MYELCSSSEMMCLKRQCAFTMRFIKIAQKSKSELF